MERPCFFKGLTMSAQILSQPIAKGLMVVSTDGLYDEKRLQTVDGGHAAEHHHKCARRKFRMAAIISLGLSLLGIIALCALAALDPTGDDPGISFWRRAVGDSTSDQGPFVKNKLYIIVLVVGLIVVIFLGIMLSAWCCRGAFENPLCCPCYLCACCGGLACLECIGCGFCAELADQA